MKTRDIQKVSYSSSFCCGLLWVFPIYCLKSISKSRLIPERYRQKIGDKYYYATDSNKNHLIIISYSFSKRAWKKRRAFGS